MSNPYWITEGLANVAAMMSNLPTETAFTVNDDHAMDQLSDLLKNVKALQKQADAERKAITAPLDARKSEVMRWVQDNIEGRLAGLEKGAKAAIGAYLQRLERERQAKAREAAEAARKEQERLAKLAAKAEARGDERKAEQFQDRAAGVVPEYVPPAAAAPEGVSSRGVWKFRVTDPSLVPREYMLVDGAKLGAVVRAMKESTNIPGVEVYKESVVAVRA
jgi:hypothetical protein